ncbi:MAG: hypothetical protein EVJ48_07460 [Candidatus Acidulodesulfobacterium acidiphilum]|uniref:Uncharacterized protein n=1 Tax=Candidatus Acidulodesulfobacterium acidiphilum TaxID=2597224 RepID=A0A520XAE9_9DELT|nr:MAG: hypothetical protein EVJ48_07460 [Candidatus Acidulodesulfobacterium acidiphilum]
MEKENVKYITGLGALNITGADWHILDNIRTGNWPMSGVDYSDTTELFGTAGLIPSGTFSKSLGNNMGNINCASPARAIADMVYHNIFTLKRYPDHVIFNDYLLEDEDITEFMKYFNIMLSFAQSQEKKQEKSMLLRWQNEFIR